MSVDKELFRMEKRNLRVEERGERHSGNNSINGFAGTFVAFFLILVSVSVSYALISYVFFSDSSRNPSSTNAIVQQSFILLYYKILSVIGVVPAAIVFGVIALPVGYTFFKIREKKRVLYGYLEIGFGIFSAIFTVGDKNQWVNIGNVYNTNLITYAVFFASIYIIVRGFDNLQQGKKQIAESNRLLDSSEQNQIDTVKYLLESGVDINCQSREGLTPLMLAVDKNNIEIVQLLISKGADWELKAKDGTTAFKIAEKNNNAELVNLLNPSK